MKEILETLGLSEVNSGVYASGWRQAHGKTLESVNPATGEVIAKVVRASAEDYEAVIQDSVKTFERWRMVPAPERGKYVRRIGDALREKKSALGVLVTMEMGKILLEGEGEVQEMVDISDFAVGLSRQLYGVTMASERPRHRMYEQWHPLGPIGIISSFNFPTAVWSWNALIAAVCGDTNVWKPSSSTPLTAIAVTNITHLVMEGSGFEGVFNLAFGSGADVGDLMVKDNRVPLVSATGSCDMGYKVGVGVARRLGRSLLELGGNNAMIVMDDADLDLVTRAALFAAVGTAGQRCTSLRRLIVHEAVVDEVARRMVDAYRQVPVGDPLDSGILMGPLVNEAAVFNMLTAIDLAKQQGGELLYGGDRLEGLGANFIQPTIMKMPKDAPILQEETFAPLLYIIEVSSVEEAIEIQNGVRQGLSSAIFTDSVRNAEKFLSHEGSDCGIANVNIGTSGAEIGGAFGGEKETGGGREAGS
ncbi:MAG TPA: aldehyde dehydrogenase family protein, partial [Actinobacteria bacterium]|nr:aldehyde dehydrogenase family protein [Actinomycetota bacterium]